MNLGDTFDEDLDGKRIESQQSRIERTMIDGEWRSLREIAALTGDPESSISARLRTFKRSGGHYEKRRRAGMERRGVWEYKFAIVAAQMELFAK